MELIAGVGNGQINTAVALTFTAATYSCYEHLQELLVTGRFPSIAAQLARAGIRLKFRRLVRIVVNTNRWWRSWKKDSKDRYRSAVSRIKSGCSEQEMEKMRQVLAAEIDGDEMLPSVRSNGPRMVFKHSQKKADAVTSEAAMAILLSEIQQVKTSNAELHEVLHTKLTGDVERMNRGSNGDPNSKGEMGIGKGGGVMVPGMDGGMRGMVDGMGTAGLAAAMLRRELYRLREDLSGQINGMEGRITAKMEHMGSDMQVMSSAIGRLRRNKPKPNSPSRKA
jgi:hypothetical protein